MTSAGIHSFVFGPFVLDPENRLLLREGQPVALTAKAFDTLLLLVERSGRLVPKDALMKAIWPGTFVDEANLTQTIFMLRRALGESASEQRYIVTVPGRGYRFAAEVKQIPKNGLQASPPSAASVELKALSKATQVKARRWPLPSGIIVALLLLAAAYFLWFRTSRPQQSPSERILLAVLPFENLTGDSSQDYFSDGLTEEMITQLGRLDPRHLGVIARSSIARYKGGEQLEQLGRELGVQYVLEGSVRRDSARVRIAMRLVQVKDQSQIWAREYDRELKSLLTMQSEIAQQVADEIQRTLGSNKLATRQLPPSPASYEAYELYLRGRYFWARRTEAGLTKAIDYFNQAIAKDPTYALAYSGLADCYDLLHFYGGYPPQEIIPKARAAAQKAVELDDQSAEAHTSLAYFTHRFDWDWEKAEREYKRALDLNSNYATAHHWYAEYLMVRGRFPEAQEQLRLAKQTDPFSLEINTDDGLPFYFTRQYDQALAEYREVVSMDPNFAPVHFALRDLYELKGSYPEAIQEFTKAIELSAGKEAVLLPLSSFARNGSLGYWRARLDLALHGPKELHATPTQIAHMYVALGEKKQALDWLERAYATRDDEVVWAAVEPWDDSLRSDPRFRDLLHKLNLD